MIPTHPLKILFLLVGVEARDFHFWDDFEDSRSTLEPADYGIRFRGRALAFEGNHLIVLLRAIELPGEWREASGKSAWIVAANTQFKCGGMGEGCIPGIDKSKKNECSDQR